VALGMPALRRIAVGKLVDQNEAWLPCRNGVEVQFGERVALIGDDPARDDFEPWEKRLGLLAAMRLADAGRGAKKDLQAALFGLLCFTQEGVRRRPSLGVAGFLHTTRYSCSTARGVSSFWRAR